MRWEREGEGGIVIHVHVYNLIFIANNRPLSSLAPYVREQLLHTVALMVKRATLDSDRRNLFDSVFTTVSQLLMMDAKMVGCICSTVKVQVYSTPHS